MRNLVDRLDQVLDQRRDRHSASRSRSRSGSRGPPSLTPRAPTPARDRRRRRSPSPRRRHVYNFVEQHLDNETYRVPRSEGKAHFLSDIHVKELIPKPYMYVERLSGHTLKKKLESSESVSALEYINAFISLLRDKRVPENKDHKYMFAHLHDVTRDAVSRPWREVRQWSQRVFDGVERGEFFWDDTQEIQNERFSLALGGSMAGTYHTQTTPSGSSEVSGRAQEVICPDFNSDRGCQASLVGAKERAHHMIGGIRYAHICMYCMAAATQRQSHAVGGCYRKERHKASSQGQGHNLYNAQSTHQYSATAPILPPIPESV